MSGSDLKGMPMFATGRVATFLAASGLAAAALLSAAGTATAAPAQSGTVQIRATINQDAAMAVVPVGASFPGVTVSLVKSNPGSAEQQWKLVPTGDGLSVRIVNTAHGQTCLDTVNGASTSLVFPGTCDASSVKQRWIVETSLASKRIRSVAFGTVMQPNLFTFTSSIAGNVFAQLPASPTDTPGKVRQGWKIG